MSLARWQSMMISHPSSRWKLLAAAPKNLAGSERFFHLSLGSFGISHVGESCVPLSQYVDQATAASGKYLASTQSAHLWVVVLSL